MAEKAKVRVGITADGQFRRLLSIGENKLGELTIGIRSAERYQFEPDGPKILHQKYSVHISLESERYNTITHSLVLDDGNRLRNYSQGPAWLGGFPPRQLIETLN